MFRYTYDQAVREGHLVDWELAKIKSNVRINGVFLKVVETVQTVQTISLVLEAAQLDAFESERSSETTKLIWKLTPTDSHGKILTDAMP